MLPTGSKYAFVCEPQANWLGNMSSIESKHETEHLVTVLQCCCRVQPDFAGGWNQHHSSGPGFRHSCIQSAACSAGLQPQPDPPQPDTASARSRRTALLCLSAARASFGTSSCKSLTSHNTSTCHATFSSMPHPCTQHDCDVIACCNIAKSWCTQLTIALVVLPHDSYL